MSRVEYPWDSHKVTSIHVEPCQSHLGPWTFLWRIYFIPSLPFNIVPFSWIRRQCSIPIVFWTPHSTLSFVSEDEGSNEVESAKFPASLGQISSSLSFYWVYCKSIQCQVGRGEENAVVRMLTSERLCQGQKQRNSRRPTAVVSANKRKPRDGIAETPKKGASGTG